MGAKGVLLANSLLDPPSKCSGECRGSCGSCVTPRRRKQSECRSARRDRKDELWKNNFWILMPGDGFQYLHLLVISYFVTGTHLWAGMKQNCGCKNWSFWYCTDLFRTCLHQWNATFWAASIWIPLITRAVLRKEATTKEQFWGVKHGWLHEGSKGCVSTCAASAEPPAISYISFFLVSMLIHGGASLSPTLSISFLYLWHFLYFANMYGGVFRFYYLYMVVN